MILPYVNDIYAIHGVFFAWVSLIRSRFKAISLASELDFVAKKDVSRTLWNGRFTRSSLPSQGHPALGVRDRCSKVTDPQPSAKSC